MAPNRMLILIIAFLVNIPLVRGSKPHTEEFLPYFIDQPIDLFVRKDQPATLNCQAAGNPKPKIEWYRKGELVKNSKNDSQRTILPDGSLFFLHFNQAKGKSNEGVYTCVASNRLGKIFSRNASLYIAAIGEEFRLNPANAVVAVGNPLVIECLPPTGKPEPTVTWKKDGALIDYNNSHYTISAGKLTINYALKKDSGAYSCFAFNQVGERESKSANISVLEKPVITNKPEEAVAKIGSNVQFYCGTKGDPQPRVWWSKERGELLQGRYDVNNENTLTIHNVRFHDAGRYVCTAENQIESVSSSALLVVEDPLDTGQMDNQKKINKELSNVRIHLDNITALPGSSVNIRWKVQPSSPLVEGFIVFYRPHPSFDVGWTEWTSKSNEYSTIIPSLTRGQKYEFKVRPFSGKIYGADSNIRHFKVPDEVPNTAPRNIKVETVDGANGTIVVSWEPPPKNIQSGIIKGYKVSFVGNETHHQADWIVDEGTKRLEIPMLASGIKYQVQVAAINDAGIGIPSNPKYIFIESPEVKMEKEEENISFQLILQVMRHPAFIATAGAVIWLLLMIFAICLCQRHSKRYRTKKQNALGNGLYRFASEDTIIKHRMDITDSPWLSNTWKSCSRNYSSTTSMNSQLLWTETKDTVDFRKSATSFERKSEGSRSQLITLVPDNSSLYGTLYVDLPGKDMTTFQRRSFVKPPRQGANIKTPEPLGLFDQSSFQQYLNNINAHNAIYGGARSKLPGRPIVPVSPNVSLKESWSKNCKKELHHVNSAPLSPYYQTSNQNGSIPSVQSLDINQAGKGDYAKVMKTFSSPKILQYTTSLKVMDLHPITASLPPPPVPPPNEDLSCKDQNKMVSNVSSYSESKQEKQKKDNFCRKKTPPSTLNIKRVSAASLSFSVNDDGDNVLTPEDVAKYLELSEHGDISRHHSECDSTLSRHFSSPNTYGYISGPLPSDLAEVDPGDEDDDLELDDVNSLKSYRKYCETPTSSISEYESSMAGSLVNGWGSVSEDNYTSARCSMVSSSDGSFLMDANFAKALAVAVDSFCLGMSQAEAGGRERLYTDFSPTSSPLDGMLADNNHGENIDITKKKSKGCSLPVLDWNIDWMDEMEAKYSKRLEMKHHFPFDKKMEHFK
ncbi:roundabout homolog 4 [Bombina bombina]|uniref:roundabout homolog 4 n=1 Tax=Bombina bombina TaxID=8345 RepID=UPI00235A7E84|nr:roundabout homolog 4 [Bombina bombina]